MICHGKVNVTPAPVCRALAHEQFQSLVMPSQRGGKQLEITIIDNLYKWQDPVYKEIKIAQR